MTDIVEVCLADRGEYLPQYLNRKLSDTHGVSDGNMVGKKEGIGRLYSPYSPHSENKLVCLYSNFRY